MSLFSNLLKLENNENKIRVVSVDENNKKLFISFPLTLVTSKARIKKRITFSDYGEPVAVKQNYMSESHYLEWQISYDGNVGEPDKNDNYKYSTINNIFFIGYKDKKKVLFELSEIIFYFHKWNILKTNDINKILKYLKNIKECDLLDERLSKYITRSLPIEKEYNQIKFKFINSSFPILIHEYIINNSITEIIIKEKQRAVGTQPMLYYCFPISLLITKDKLIGRKVQKKEIGFFEINNYNIKIFLEIFKIFGMLSKSHNFDTIKILEKIISDDF